MVFSCVAVIMACRYSVSFLKTSMNSTMPRNEVQRLLEHRAAFDRVDGLEAFEAALQLFREGALAGADGAHQVEHLTAFLTLERCRVEVADDLADRLLDAEEFVPEEVVDLEGVVLVE